ncbi:hypothetical protein [Desulfobacca acetoxidans]
MISSWNADRGNRLEGEVSEFAIQETAETLRCLSSSELSPFAENYALILRNNKEKKKLLKTIRENQEKEDALISALAAEVFRLTGYLEKVREVMTDRGLAEQYRGLHLTTEKILDLLEEADLEVIDLAGQPLDEKILRQVEVLKYLQEDGLTEPVVKETIEPLVYRRGKCIKKGVVIGAAPPEILAD